MTPLDPSADASRHGSATADVDNRPSVLFLSGPNLDMLGIREPAIYGHETLQDHVDAAREVAARHGFALFDIQSASEAELVSAVHRARGRHVAIVINPGAFTHYAWALHDALCIFDGMIVEVHLSNPVTREPWRHTSVVSPVARASIVGLGGLGYELAIEAVARKLGTSS